MAKGAPTPASWKPGKSGNPNGRPKKDDSMRAILERALEDIEPKSKKQYKELVSKRLVVEAINGNVVAAKQIFDRMDGMPPQALDHTTSGEKIEVVFSSSLDRRDGKK